MVDDVHEGFRQDFWEELVVDVREGVVNELESAETLVYSSFLIDIRSGKSSCGRYTLGNC